ncbi:cupin domain-containing protein, partial [Rhizobium leguminosarum]|uniref:cupin domain-containing protein n=1 Tax=Rhizobium leguminosarum TaxID=384 RepID=UPI003F9CCE15
SGVSSTRPESIWQNSNVSPLIDRVSPEGGEPVVYKAGDSFVMKPGFVGVWKTIETVRKIYVTV